MERKEKKKRNFSRFTCEIRFLICLVFNSWVTVTRVLKHSIKNAFFSLNSSQRIITKVSLSVTGVLLLSIKYCAVPE